MIGGFFSSWVLFAFVLALHLVVPARSVEGYVRHEVTGARLRYRLNGLRVLFVVVAACLGLVRAGVIAADYLWLHRWEGLAGACTFGLIFTFGIVLTAPPTGKGSIADLYLGRRPNPQWDDGRVDAKMYLYLVGAILLALNLLSFAAHQAKAFGHLSPGVALYVALFSFFVAEYLFFEEVHLYTYDFFAERVGFKLGWGCLTFYPYFYCIGLWSAATKPDPRTPTPLLVACALIFFSGWALSRGANLQKFIFKTRPTAKAFGLLPPTTITDGTHTLLCSGFWRVSRHVNYLGEILMATGLTLSLGWPRDPLPWLYPLYYVALLFPRQADDDRRCAEKYGDLWTEYCRRVRWRIVPGIY
jgi:delta14-sterol reductase